MTRWREAVLLFMATGFVWYLFLAPQQGAGSVDNRAKEGFQQGRETIETVGDAAVGAARNLLTR